VIAMTTSDSGLLGVRFWPNSDYSIFCLNNVSLWSARSRSRRFNCIILDRIRQILIFLIRYFMCAVTKCMSNFPGNFLCSMSDSTRTITKAMSNHFGRLLGPVADCLSSLLGFVDRMHFA